MAKLLAWGKVDVLPVRKGPCPHFICRSERRNICVDAHLDEVENQALSNEAFAGQIRYQPDMGLLLGYQD